MDDEDDPLSSLTLYGSDDEDDKDDTDPPPSSSSSLRQQKLTQTESQFLLQKSSWRPQDDIALSHARLTLPLPLASPENLKIRAEQEYYLRRYADALGSAREALRRIEEVMSGGEGGGRAAEGERRELRELVGRCEGRVGMREGEGRKT